MGVYKCPRCGNTSFMLLTNSIMDDVKPLEHLSFASYVEISCTACGYKYRLWLR